MVLHDVSDDTILIKVASPTFCAKGLLKAYLHTNKANLKSWLKHDTTGVSQPAGCAFCQDAWESRCILCSFKGSREWYYTYCRCPVRRAFARQLRPFVRSMPFSMRVAHLL